jgi:putative molybdopterin biosynthesis protein
MRLTFALQLALDGRDLDRRLMELLEALHAHGSVAAAARHLGCSYRFAWDRLREAESAYGQPLVRMEPGRGARLTDLGVGLLEVRTRAGAAAQQPLQRVALEFERALTAGRSQAPHRLSLAASHDLALIELKDFCLLAQPRLDLDIRFRGSLDALVELAHGRCDIAGFHIEAQAVEAKADPRPAIRRSLSARRDRLIVLGERNQGLMLAAGNPKAIGAVSDLARRGVRFVNRQAGSGTRLLFDRLLARAGRSKSDLLGYDTEEFTHVAVAATIASGHADAGFGIQAAAAAYGLAFLPVIRETYYLAARRTTIDTEAVRRLVEHLRSAPLRKRLLKLAGYDFAACGTLLEIEEALGRIRPSK